MGTEDKRRQFDEIVAHLTAEDPSLGHAVRRRWPRSVLIAVLVCGGLGWALLNVAMVAWGAKGVLLTVACVALAAIAGLVDAHRRRLR